ncbi:MAG: autotransporter outer membrane beta-barrel domain-containing protein [Rhodospirillales bacterium]|nr:autotransporter outer membrane beta-barrel domain-containing protein [Rhodospirillales bacterium]
MKRTLAAVARRALSSALENIGARFASSIPDSGLTLAGTTLRLGAARGPDMVGASDLHRAAGRCSAWPHRHDFRAGTDGCPSVGMRSRDVEADELLRTSAFSLTLGAAEGSGPGGSSVPLWAVWGRGDLGTFAGRPEPGMRYDGELRTGWLGIDARAGPWVAGLAFSHGKGEADYGFDQDGLSGQGRLETTLNAFYPYGRWTIDEGLELRAVLGAGTGEARHVLNEREAETSDLAMRMASVGVRRELPALGEFDLAVRADASIARLETDSGPQFIDNLSADTWRGRVGLEASRRFALGEDAALTPFVEAAGRGDGGDGLTGAGIELAGGVRYRAPGLEVEARGRWLAAHVEEGARERGVSVTARVGPGAHGRGLSLLLAPRWGAETGRADALWSEELPRLAGGTGNDAASLDARMGYGLALAPQGLLTPFAETALTGGERRRLRLGTRFDATGADLGVELAGERRESAAAEPEHALTLDVIFRF